MRWIMNNQTLKTIIQDIISKDETKAEKFAPILTMLNFNNKDDSVYGKEEKISKAGGL